MPRAGEKTLCYLPLPLEMQRASVSLHVIWAGSQII
jgi:hypothetical protein